MSVVEGLGFHTLRAERTETVAAEGTLPDWLTGTLLRNGPEAFETGGTAVDHWFDRLAMVHRFAFDGPADRVGLPQSSPAELTLTLTLGRVINYPTLLRSSCGLAR